MTLIEAYSFLAKRYTHFKDNPDLYSRALIESTSIAIDCMAMRNPRKPEWVSKMPKCPICHNWINNNETTQKYCNYCGQAIDWEENSKKRKKYEH